MEEIIYSEIKRASARTVRNCIGSGLEEESEDSEYFACYSASGFLMLLQRRISEGIQESPQSYAGKTSNALLKFIRPAE